MKILVIRSSNPFAASTASNNRFLSLAGGLIERGCVLELLILEGIYNHKERDEFGIEGVRNNISYKYLIKPDCSNFFIRQFYLRILPKAFSFHKIETILQNGKHKYVWLESSINKNIITTGLWLFKRELNVKYFHERSEYSWIGLRNNQRYHKKYLHKFLPQLDFMLVMTRTLGAYYKQYVDSRTKLLHLPMTVDLARFANVNEKNNLNKPYIAYCGAMNNSKDGVDVLIQAFIRIKDKYPDLHLYLAGPLQPEKDYFMQTEIIKRANCGNRISYLGNISRDKIPVFLSNASVLALARPNSKQAEGGFPTKLGEYLATGNPVCVTRVGEIGDYLKNEISAYIAEPDSVDSFANTLRKSLTDNRRIIIGENGKKVAYKHFNKDIQAELLYKFLVKNN